MMLKLSFAVIGIIIVVKSEAQPNIVLLGLFDNNHQEFFYDVYAVSDGGLIMCGSTTTEEIQNPSFALGDIYIVRTDGFGRESWSCVINGGNQALAKTIIETDNGDFVGGGIRNSQFYAFKISSQGEVLWNHTYNSGVCEAIIELKSGECFLAGRSQENHPGEGYLALINGDNGDVIWDHSYSPGFFGQFYSMRETIDGTVIAGRGMENNRQSIHVWAVKVNTVNGDIIWDQFYDNIPPYSAWSITSTGDGSFMVCGNADNNNIHGEYMMEINDRGNRAWHTVYDNSESYEFLSIARLSNLDFVLVGSYRVRAGLERPFAMHSRPDGSIRWQAIYPIDLEPQIGSALNRFNSVTQLASGEIVASGWAMNDINDSGYDGLIMKLDPPILFPIIFYHVPEDTTLTVLPQDTIAFTVRARDQLGREMDYYWQYDGGDTLDTDTTFTHTFDDMGEHTIQCQVSNGEFTSAITWHISVTDLYIASHTPDSTAFSIRRGSSLDFGLNYRATDDGPVTIDWYKSDQGDGFPVSHEPNTTLTFDQPGDLTVEGRVYRGEIEDNVIWNISVRSVVSVYRPSVRNITAYLDTTITFVVEPFNPESPELQYNWLLDGDNISENPSVVLGFNEPREYSVIAYIYDGVEGDTLVWNVTVLPDDVGGGIGITPHVVGLSAFPNPFNSQTTVNYNLPVHSQVSLSIYDITGKLVTNLFQGVQSAGAHSAMWYADNFAAGLYIIRFQTTGTSISQKLVIVK